LHDVRRFKAVLHEWVEEHKDDKGFLNLFNKKYISEQRQSDMIHWALSGRRDNVQPYIFINLLFFALPTFFVWLIFNICLESKRYPGQKKKEAKSVRTRSARQTPFRIEGNQQREVNKGT
jgi:hypothetical protein